MWITNWYVIGFLIVTIVTLVAIILILLLTGTSSDPTYNNIQQIGVLGYNVALSGVGYGTSIAIGEGDFVTIGSINGNITTFSRTNDDFKQIQTLSGVGSLVFSDKFTNFSITNTSLNEVNTYELVNGILVLGEKLKESDSLDFGYEIAYTADKMYVGMSYSNGNNTGGAVRVINRLGSSLDLNHTSLIHPEDSKFEDFFGKKIVWVENSNQLLVGAPQAYNSVSSHVGAVYVFSSTETQQQKLQDGDLPIGADFGESIAVSYAGDYGMIGAPNDTYDITNLYTSVHSAGSVTLITRIGKTWSTKYRIYSPNPSFNGKFGSSIVITKDLIYIGAYGENKVYVYQKSNNTNDIQLVDIIDVLRGDIEFGFKLISGAATEEVFISAPKWNTSGGFFLVGEI